jgi:small subunit ribosomal protein S8e
MKHGRKLTGGRYTNKGKKKLHSLRGQQRITKLGEIKTKSMGTRGGNSKKVSLTQNQANVIVKGKAQKAKISNVLETPSNRFWARQNIITKGAIIETELGKAQITNRPSQEGMIQAVLVPEEN